MDWDGFCAEAGAGSAGKTTFDQVLTGFPPNSEVGPLRVPPKRNSPDLDRLDANTRWR